MLSDYERNIVEQRDFRAVQMTIYKTYFKQTITNNAKTWALTKRNKSKIQTMGMTSFRSTEGKTRRGGTGN
jgi:CRISPR/Cas system-associated protein Csx1